MNYNPVVSVVGLGYVGLPVAVAMAKKFNTIGFDINKLRVEELRANNDRTGEVTSSELRDVKIHYTDEINALREATFHIVAVPTPVDEAHRPDMGLVLRASETVGKALKKGDIVVYESTVYPGATEEDCVPVLERVSGLKCGADFKVGYSPERINPGDKEHTFTKIKKVVSGQDEDSLAKISHVYGTVVTAGVFAASSIRVAEAAKVIENTQRDLNIALMNELAVIFDRMGIDTLSVLEAAGTKWNFLAFRPGLVGGHCIGVDPYYLTHKAETLGYHPEVILAGRKINDSIGSFVAQKTIKKMLQARVPVVGATVTVLGLTFKENCPDLRNSKVIDIIRELKDFGVRVQICDPTADSDEAHHEYGVRLTAMDKLEPAQAVVIAVAHQQFRTMKPEDFRKLFSGRGILIDVKGLLKPEQVQAIEPLGFWRL